MQDEEMDEEDNSEQALPDLLTDFGIVTKIRQLNKLLADSNKVLKEPSLDYLDHHKVHNWKIKL